MGLFKGRKFPAFSSMKAWLELCWLCRFAPFPVHRWRFHKATVTCKLTSIRAVHACNYKLARIHRIGLFRIEGCCFESWTKGEEINLHFFAEKNFNPTSLDSNFCLARNVSPPFILTIVVGETHFYTWVPLLGSFKLLKLPNFGFQRWPFLTTKPRLLHAGEAIGFFILRL